MNEHEARLRTLILERTYSDTAKTQYEADISALKDAARDAALDEAARRVASLFNNDIAGGLDTPRRFALTAINIIRALKSQPARQYVDAEKVREVLPYLRTVCGLSEQEVGEVLRRLGVDLDAKPAAAKADFYEQGGLIPPEGKR